MPATVNSPKVEQELPAFEWVGADLNRPECVLTHASGWTFAASWAGSGGVAAIAPDGTTYEHLANIEGPPMRPNGIALAPDGSFLLAHLGPETGGVFRLNPDRSLEPVLTEVAGRAIPPSNFPVLDALGRLWLSISTTVVPRADDYRPTARTGFIVVKDARGARIVVDDIGYANEFIISPDGQTLYANETFRRRIISYRISADCSLRDPKVIATFGAGTFPDGLAMDSEGGLWVTSIVSNRVIRVDPEGGQTVFIEDCDQDHLAWVEEAFVAGQMGRPHLDNVRSRVLRSISSLAFGGPDLRKGYLGCLLGDRIATVKMPVAGMPMPHHTYDIADLTRTLSIP